MTGAEAPRRRKKRPPEKEARRGEKASRDVTDAPEGEKIDAPELERLEKAFEAGNYALVRKAAPLLAKRSDDERVRRAALDLARRLAPDPIAVYLLCAAGALLAFFAFWYFTHRHAGP